jgi:hypothetical protein
LLVKKGLVKTAPGPAKRDAAKLATTPYVRQAAETVGQSERAVRRDLARGSKIAPEILAAVAGTPEDKGVVLDTSHIVSAHLPDRPEIGPCWGGALG